MARGVACEIQHQRCNLAGLGDSSVRAVFGCLGQKIVDVLFHQFGFDRKHRRVHVARADRVHAESRTSVVFRHRPREHDQPPLADAVGDVIGACLQAPVRRDIHDAAC